MDLWEVPKVWPKSTIAILGGGPSLSADDIELLDSDIRIIAINDSYRKAPTADILYAADARWWNWHNNAPGFLGVRVGLAWDNEKQELYPGWDSVNLDNIRVLAATGHEGLETEPWAVRTGHNSGYQAINLAVHFGARRILLLGFDMQPVDGKHHWFGSHPDNVPPPPYSKMRPAFDSLVEPLKELNIEVYNCTPGSALTCFPMAELEDAA